MDPTPTELIITLLIFLVSILLKSTYSIKREYNECDQLKTTIYEIKTPKIIDLWFWLVFAVVLFILTFVHPA